MVVQAKDYSAITSISALQKLLDKLLSEDKPVGFDLETGYSGEDWKKRSVDIYHDSQFVVGFSITNSQNWARYIPLRHDSGGNIDDPERAWEIVKPVLTKGHVVAHNAKFELANVRKAGGYVIASDGGKLTDTMLDAFVAGKYCHSNYRTIVGLKDLVDAVFDHKMMHIHDLWPDLPANKFDYIRFNTLDVTPEVVAYACEDALWCLALLGETTVAAEVERPFTRELEHQIMFIMEDVERRGVSIDWPAIEAAYAEAQTFVPSMEVFVKGELGKMANRDLVDLNLNSATQMKKLLFSEIGLVTTRLTKKGETDDTLEPWQRMSSDAKALTALAKDYDAIKSLLEYREVQNLNRRLKKWLREYSVDFDRKAHANYNQVQVASGRFAAGEPAIQQLPKKWKWVTDPLGKRSGIDYWSGNFRDFIVASPDHYLLTYDYSQVELRMLAGASQEPALLEAFEADVDIHTRTSSMMLGKPEHEITPEDRQIGKMFNFAILYGMGPKALGEQLGVDFNRAKELYAQYFVAFTRINSWFNRTKSVGLERGYAETIFGRKIPVWELGSSQQGIRAKGERVLINGTIQGSAADYMKIAMVRTKRELERLGWWGTKCTIVMNQHDSLSFDVSNELDPAEVKEVLQKKVVFDASTAACLEGFPNIRADWELGQRWGSADKWEAHCHTKWDSERGIWTVVREVPKHTAFAVTENPSEDAWKDFLRTLKENPGDTEVEFRAIGGNVTLPFRVALDQDTEKKLIKTLSGATVEHTYEGV